MKEVYNDLLRVIDVGAMEEDGKQITYYKNGETYLEENSGRNINFENYNDYIVAVSAVVRSEESFITVTVIGGSNYRFNEGETVTSIVNELRYLDEFKQYLNENFIYHIDNPQNPVVFRESVGKIGVTNYGLDEKSLAEVLYGDKQK